MRIFPTVTRKVIVQSGDGCPPTFVYNEPERRADAIRFNALRLVDSEARADALRLQSVRLGETEARVDTFRLPNLAIRPDDFEARADAARIPSASIRPPELRARADVHRFPSLSVRPPETRALLDAHRLPSISFAAPETRANVDAPRIPSASVRPPETRALTDAARIPAAQFAAPETRAAADIFRIPSASVRPPETRALADVFRLPSISVRPADTRGVADRGRFTVTIDAVSRSGAPNNDIWGDAWVDATLGQAGVNHGNEANLSISALVIGVKQAYVEANLGIFAGLTAVGGSHSISAVLVTGVTGGNSVTQLRVGGQAARPFTESTIANNNKPAIPGTSLGTKTQAASTTARQTWALTDSQMNALLGQWMLAVFTIDATLGNNHVLSREAAAADRIQIIFTAEE